MASLVDFAQIISGFSTTGALLFMWNANRSARLLHKESLNAQEKLKKQEVFFQVANTWNGNALLQTRVLADLWLAQIPGDHDPQQWLRSYPEACEWTQFAILAHFLRHVEGLIEEGILDGGRVAKHLGGAGWWARELMCLYNYWPDVERPMVEALSSLAKRYKLNENTKRGQHPYPDSYLIKRQPVAEKLLVFDATWAA